MTSLPQKCFKVTENSFLTETMGAKYEPKAKGREKQIMSNGQTNRQKKITNYRNVFDYYPLSQFYSLTAKTPKYNVPSTFAIIIEHRIKQSCLPLVLDKNVFSRHTYVSI